MLTHRLTSSIFVSALILLAGMGSASLAQGTSPLTVKLDCMREGAPLEGVAQILVRNAGPVAGDVVLVSEFDQDKMLYLRDTAGGLRSRGRIVWRLGDLKLGEERQILWHYRILPHVQGDVLVRAAVSTAGVITSSNAYRIQVVRVAGGSFRDFPEENLPSSAGENNGLGLMVTHGQAGRVTPKEFDEGSGFYYLVTIRNNGSLRQLLRLVFQLTPQLDIDGSERLGLVPLFTTPFVTQTLAPEPLAGDRYRILFPGPLDPGKSYNLKIPVMARRGGGPRTAGIRLRLAWIARDAETGKDTGDFGDLLAGHKSSIGKAEPAPPVYRGPEGEVPPTGPDYTGPQDPPEPEDPSSSSALPPVKPPSFQVPVLHVAATAGKADRLDIHAVKTGDSAYFLITLENRSEALFDVLAEVKLTEGLVLDSTREIGLVGSRDSQKVLLPLDLEDLGESRYKLVKGGGFWLLGNRTAHILIPVTVTGSSGESAERMRVDLTWKAHDPETKEYRNRKGEFSTGAYLWIEKE